MWAVKLLGTMVTYRRNAELADTLRLLREQTRPPDVLLVVDNADDPECEDLCLGLANAGEPVHYLAAGGNLGPAGALALGMSWHLDREKGDAWLLSLDDDDPPGRPDVLARLLAFGEAQHALDSQVGAVGLVGARLDRRRGRLVRPADEELVGPLDVDYVGGGQFPLYRSAVVRAVGGCDPRYFFGFDDLELGCRIRSAGYRVLVDGEHLLEQRRAVGRTGLTVRPSSDWTRPAWRDYYSTRNLVHLLKDQGHPGAALRLALTTGLAKPLLATLRDPRRGLPRARLQLRAAADGWAGRLGDQVTPEAKPVPGSAPAGTSPGDAEMLVMMMPPPSPALANSYVNHLSAHLEAAGAQVVPYRRQTALSGRGTLLHLHWPDAVLSVPSTREAARRTAKLLATLLLVRARGAGVIWTAHNARSHEGRHPALERVLWASLSRSLSGWTCFSATARRSVEESLPALAGLPCTEIGHPQYPEVLDRCPSQEEARVALGLPADGRVVLVLGLQRRYKRTVEVVRGFLEADLPDVHLVVAGQVVQEGYGEAVVSAAAGDPRVTLMLERQDDERVRLLLGAADLVAVGYRSAMNSGAMMLALSADRAVLAPDTATFLELRHEFGTEWLRLHPGFPHAEAWRELLRAGGSPAEPCAGIRTRTWEKAAAETLAAYRALAAPGRHG